MLSSKESGALILLLMKLEQRPGAFGESGGEMKPERWTCYQDYRR